MFHCHVSLPKGIIFFESFNSSCNLEVAEISTFLMGVERKSRSGRYAANCLVSIDILIVLHMYDCTWMLSKKVY